MDWSQNILHLNSKFKKNAENNQLICTSWCYQHYNVYTRWMCKCLEHRSLCFPDKEGAKPTVPTIIFLPLFRCLDSTAWPGSRNYSTNGFSPNTDICVTKGSWTCHDNCQRRTLTLGETQGSIFAPLLNVRVSKSPIANFLLMSLKGRAMGSSAELFELLRWHVAWAQSFYEGVWEVVSAESLYFSRWSKTTPKSF